MLAAAPGAAASDAPPDGGRLVRKAGQIVLHIPFANERVRRHMHRANTHGERVLLYRVELENGVVGWGESPLDHAAGLARAVGRHAAAVAADDRAGFGLQMAAVDALGRSYGLPAWQLLGARRRERVPVAWWAIDMPPEDWAAELAEAARRGYASAKLKGRPWRDLAAQLDAVERAVPADFRVIIDFNGFLLDAERAEAYLRGLDARRVVAGYESPFYLQHDPAGAARLAAALDKPVIEHFNETLLRAGAADAFLVPANYQSLGAIRRRDAQCALHDRPYWLQMVGTGLTTAFMAHLGATLTHARLPAVTCHELWEDDLLARPLDIEGGTLAVPDGPGLGVEVDTAAIERYRVAGRAVPTPKERYLARPRTIRIHLPAEGRVLAFPAERIYYDEFLKGLHPGFLPGTRLEVIERP